MRCGWHGNPMRYRQCAGASVECLTVFRETAAWSGPAAFDMELIQGARWRNDRRGQRASALRAAR